MVDTFDVAVVGYGPTGMTAAALLGQRDRRVIVIERWPGLYGLPRLTHMDDETARILQEVSDIDVALEDSTPTQYKWVNAAGQIIYRIPSFTGNQGYTAHMSIYQPDIEDAVHARVESLDSVTLRRGWALVSLQQDADGVDLVIAPFADRALDLSRSETVRARYVIGADGNKSVVRDQLGVTMRDYGFDETWVNLDMQWITERPEAYAISTQYCDPARGHMTMGIGRRHQRFEYAVLPGEDKNEMATQEYGWRWLREVHGLGPDELKLSRQIAYTFAGRLADRWRVGRVLLAGDAAHVMPPYLGQGACSGIRDASNLAWKLDLVLGGVSPETLLDTYQVERSPHAEAMIVGSIELGRIANTNDVEAAARRDEALLSGHGSDPAAMPRLAGGALRPHDVDPLSGTVPPQGTITVGGRTGLADDLLGPGFQVIVAAGAWDPLAGELSGPLQELAAQTPIGVLDLGAPDVSDDTGLYAQFLADSGVVLAVIRPDHIVFGASDAAGADALLQDLRTALSAGAVLAAGAAAR